MPTDTVYGERTREQWTKSGSNYTLSSKSNVRYPLRSRTWPASVKRVKPFGPDEFMSGTSRIVTSEIRNDGGISYSQYSDTYRIYNDNIYSLWDVSGPLTRSKSGAGAITLPTTGVDQNVIYNAIRAKIRGEATNLANMLGEYRQTAQLFRDLAEVVHTRGSSLLKRHPRLRGVRRTVDIPSSAANAHLQFVYGIKPLMQDLGTSVGEIVSRAQYPVYIQGNIARRTKASVSGFQTSGTTGAPFVAAVEYETSTFQRSTYRAFLSTNALKSSLAQHGMLNPLSLAWELTPYSFVVDWFVNVGDILSSLDNLLIFDSLYVIDSRSNKYVRRYSPLQPDYGTSIIRNGSLFLHNRQDARSAPAKIGLLVTPAYKPSVSLGHIVNGLALLQQLRR